jgi:hypothetical protein
MQRQGRVQKGSHQGLEAGSRQIEALAYASAQLDHVESCLGERLSQCLAHTLFLV